ncbi:MAG: CDP-glycerol glycerophosphotransferase family protein [Agromyces sp.]
MIVPRRNGLWAFGSGVGFGEGGVALAHRAHESGIRVVWLSRRPSARASAREAGFSTAAVSSIRGWWVTLRAEVLVVTHGLGDVNPYAQHGATIVQLWHGIPLKHLHRDAGVTYSLPRFPGSRLAERALRAASELAYQRISLFVVASQESARRLSSAFGLRPDQVLVSGDPRDDVILRGDLSERIARARAQMESALGVGLQARVVLVAPTWRDGRADPVVPSIDEWDALTEWANATATSVVFRPHPLAIGAYREGIVGRNHLHLLEVQNLADVNTVLAACDIVVTDYSSIAYDFALLERPMVYLMPDLEAYTAARGFYEPIELFSGGVPARSWADALGQLDAILRGTSIQAAVAHAIQIVKRVHDFTDGASTERVFAAIRNR